MRLRCFDLPRGGKFSIPAEVLAGEQLAIVDPDLFDAKLSEQANSRTVIRLQG
jgi:hypothetical protein